VRAAGEIALLQTKVAQHRLHELYVLGLSAMGCARNCELFVAPLQSVESAGREKWKHLEWLRAGAPEGERFGIARGAEELVALSNYRSMYSMLRLGSLTASYCNIELIRFDHNFKISSWVPRIA
jgi:hypothetical protein